MNFPLKTLSTIIAGLALTPATIANETSQNKKTSMTIGEEVIIIGKSNDIQQVELSGSQDLLARDQLENEHVNFTADIFKKIPGIYFSRFNQGIISANIAMRGFDGEGSSPHSKLLIDGIPSNLHVGYPEMDALFPMEIDHVKVVKGTFDPRYGLHNVAGNVQMFSRQTGDAKEIELMYGSFDTYEAQGYYADEGESLSQSYFLGTRKTAGYRDHSDLDKTTVSGKWFYDLNEDLNVGLIARHFTYEADAPGYLSETAAHQTPEASLEFSNTDGGEKTTDHLSLHLNYQIAENIEWVVKAYHQSFDRHRWVRFTAAASQQERVEDEKQNGVISILSWQLNPAWLIQWGLDYEAQDNLHQRFVSNQRQRGAVSRNQEFDFNHYGSYLQIENQLTEKLQWNAGVRVNRYTGDFTNLANNQQRDINDYGNLTQPAAGLNYEATSNLSLFANWGKTYQIGNGISAYALPGKDVDASENTGSEIGFQLTPQIPVELRFSLWQQDASSELTAKPDGSGDFENIGKTEREGWEILLSWQPADAWYLWTSYTRQKAILAEPGLTNAAIKGNWLNHIPAYSAALGIDYQINNSWKISLFNTSQSDSYVSNNNSLGKFGDYSLTELRVGYEYKNHSLGLQITNLFDEYYEYVWFDTSTLHSPGDARAINLSWAIEF
jgi:iron complex outermembrane recepter protein